VFGLARGSLSDLEVELLMKLQYEFPLTPTPFLDVAESLGLELGEALGVLRDLVNAGILKRVGFYYNYRSQGHVAALVAFSCGDSYEGIARLLAEDPLVTHNFLRDHPVYNVWAVIKRGSREELLSYVDRVAREGGASGWIALFSRRTFKLSVKFDLREGISRSGPYSAVVEDPPRPEDLGINPMIPKLVRSLELVERPYRMIASRAGLSEDEVVGLVKEMLDKGILADPGAALEGRSLGFAENAMVVMGGDDDWRLCECASELPYSTHVVLREPYPPGSWIHNCYFMVHATSRSKIEGVVEVVKERCKPRSIMPIYSLADLKPGVVR
jgi:DNA-binding Lrp family transcriptional regulator